MSATDSRERNPWLQLARREETLVLALYGLGRLALGWAGLRFSWTLNWMFLADPADLKDELLQTLLYFHVYPPGMNVLTGLLLKLSVAHFAALAHGVYLLSGALLAVSLCYLARGLGLSRWSALVLSLVFSLAPPTLFFENLYLYTYPVASLLCCALACLHRAIVAPGFVPWLSFFLVCSLLGWIRSTFHISWFLLMLGVAWFCAGAPQRRLVLKASLAPSLLLLSLYVKNWILFDSFAATSAAGGNLVHVTLNRLSSQERKEWIRDGKISPIANVSVYASPRAYLPFFGSPENDQWPHQLTDLDRATINAPNYNHWFFMEANKERSKAANVYLRERPTEYAQTVIEAAEQFFSASTRWHPFDRPKNGRLDEGRLRKSPHYEHHQVLGGYERIYELALHSFPVPGVGLYALLPAFVLWGLFRCWKLRRPCSPTQSAELAILAVALLQMVYVVTVSSLFTIGESARYRFQIEPLIWLLVAAGTNAAWTSIATRLEARSRPS